MAWGALVGAGGHREQPTSSYAKVQGLTHSFSPAWDFILSPAG